MMNKFVTALMLIAGLSAGAANAEVVFAAGATTDVAALPKNAKVRVRNFGNNTHEAISQLLTSNGYVVVSNDKEAEYFLGLSKLHVGIEVDGKKRAVDPQSLDDYKETVVPAAASEILGKDSGAIDASPGGRVRSALDADAGVIAQGANLTGSGVGGLVIGAIGGLIGMAVDKAAQSQDDVVPGVVYARGIITKKGDSKGTFVALKLASKTNEKPAALFEAAIKQYVGLATQGFTVSANADGSPVKAENVQ